MKIAISPRFMDLNNPDFLSQRYFINYDFVRMAKKLSVGLCPIMSTDEYEEICKLCDGLIIPGSGNGVNPTYYGEESKKPYTDYDEYALDSKLIDYFFKNDKPILGICAGHQALNIYFGGKLGYITNDGSKPHMQTTHPVDMKRDSFLYEAFGTERAQINSFHIMHITELGKDLEVVAKSDDGIIEAIEHKEKAVFGVQWHPERAFPAEDSVEWKLLESFINYCRK